jgi:glutamine amidotransferase PdxT
MEMYRTQQEKQQGKQRMMVAILAAAMLAKVYHPDMTEDECLAVIKQTTGEDQATTTLAAYIWADAVRRAVEERISS